MVGALEDELVGVVLELLDDDDDEEVDAVVDDEDVDGVDDELLVDELLVCGSARTKVTVRLTAGAPVAFFTVSV